MLKNIVSYNDSTAPNCQIKINGLQELETALERLLNEFSNCGWLPATNRKSLGTRFAEKSLEGNDQVSLCLEPNPSLSDEGIKGFWDHIFARYYATDIKWDAQVTLAKNYKNSGKFTTVLELQYVLNIQPFNSVEPYDLKRRAVLAALNCLIQLVQEFSSAGKSISHLSKEETFSRTFKSEESEFFEIFAENIDNGAIAEKAFTSSHVEKEYSSADVLTAVAHLNGNGHRKQLAAPEYPIAPLENYLNREEHVLREKLKAIVIENPYLNLVEILVKIRATGNSEAKIPIHKVYKTLKTLNLESKAKRLRFYRSR